ncbi:MAG TPA: transposase [Anaerolineaceae bacterium]|nr:transposase [Anaerolineaceae bacterium]
MSSPLKPMHTIPIDTFDAARKVYNLAHVYLIIGDRLQTLLKSADLTRLDPASSLDAPTALRLAMVTAFQYAESLPDSAAEEAIRRRMDWKYALHLSLDHPGYSGETLCQFRRNLFSSSESLADFHQLLIFLGEAGLYSKADLKSIDAIEVLTTICQISRIARLNQVMKRELSRLVGQTPDWLRANAPPHWYARYATGRLGRLVSLEPAEMVVTAERLGADLDTLIGLYQRERLKDTDDPSGIGFLNQLLEEQFIRNGDGLHWRFPGCLDCARRPRDA